MKRFTGVLLREGYGWISVRDAIVAAPPDVAAFGVIERAQNVGVYGFVVVDTPTAVAVLADRKSPFVATSEREKAIGLLLRGGHPLVAWMGDRVDGVEVAHCFGDLPDAIERAACAIVVAKTPSGAAGSEAMTVVVRHGGAAARVRVHAENVSGSWEADVERLAT